MTVQSSAAPIYVGIDVGGTFTDLTIYTPSSGQTRAVKVPSNRARPDEAVLAGLEKAEVAGEAVKLIVHGTTVATNALLERRGAQAAFVTTEGFRDVLELGRTTRLVPNSLYDPFFERPQPLIRRRNRRTVRERIEADGRVSAPLDEAALDALGAALAAEGNEAVVVGFVNSYLNPEHERRAGEILSHHFPHVTISTGIVNEIREFERFSAAAINGYVMPVMASYIGRLTGAVRERYPASGFYTVASHGGLLSTASATTQPVKTVLSGPAAGIAATVHLARTIDTPNLITYDMGGTSTDVALVADAAFPLKRETLLDGLIIRLPQLDIHTVGAGGGSIASVDAGGSLLVGPESAGAVPGPAAYGKGGTRATVTDANVVLRRLGASQEMGRSLRIDAEKAEAVVRPIAEALGIGTVEAAEAILRLAVAKMAAAVHEISVARGFDPREFSLLAYGGAGPLHAALVAQEVGIPSVIVPPAPGAFSAFGALCSALAKDRSITLLGPLDDGRLTEIRRHFKAMAVAIAEEFTAEGADVGAIAHEYQFDLRYNGQAHELTVSCEAGADASSIVAAFEAAFERQFGRRDSERGVQVVNIRLIGRIPIETPSWKVAGGGGGKASSRQVAVDGRFVACPVWQRDELDGAEAVNGPAVIEEMSATTYVPPGWQARVGAIGQLTLTRLQENAAAR
ncbi:hydantoinase/oxoprolinase family protein [Bosea sp. (in: a-proteobacteria)]|uniref:hydantoinase/oxoprolinase family protein n=1 Tax=Bosea sp. (in: a-proteobacteria) TaxID=1871050 RepID=UPI002618E859|nr:hydantoinase/oxoprolinase family protein [Bosea sp. (in: a-proteobacteria)]MCO5089521.1 hydantoinase/oxoprolinase family protein [Bosea sp. (in: a-proteobacteria)]